MMKSTQPGSFVYQETYQDSIETSSSVKCRLCWQQDGELICPCKCSGHQAYVHYNCLLNQIETARIMKVANVEGYYNSRCPLCKFHIQFKIQEHKCSLSKAGIKQAFNSLDEDTTACLTLNLPIILVLFSILLIIISGHIRTRQSSGSGYNCKFIVLQILLILVEYILIKNVSQRFPYKIRKPVLVTKTNP